MKNFILFAIIFPLTFLNAHAATVESMPQNHIKKMYKQAEKEDWSLPGIKFNQMKDLLLLFDGRVQKTTLEEARAFNEYKNEIPLSFDNQGFLLDLEKQGFDILPSSKRSNNATVLCEIYPYDTRYVPRILKDRKQQKPVWTSQRIISNTIPASFNPNLKKHGVYRLSIKVQNNAGKIFKRTVYFAIRYRDTRLEPKEVKQFKHPKGRPLITQYYVVKTPNQDILNPDGKSISAEEDFKVYKKLGYDGIHIIAMWDDLEIIPGGYDFNALDNLVQTAGKLEMAVEIFVIYQGHRLPIWLWQNHMIDQEGNVSLVTAGRFRITPGMQSLTFRSSYVKLIKKIIRRYDHLSYVTGYHLSMRNVEWAYPRSNRKNRQVFDYSPSARKSFQAFLKEKNTLDKINASYQTNFTSWDDIELPQPNFEQIDLRKIWWDFVDFKLKALRNNAQEFSFGARELTQKKLIMYNFGGFGPIDNLFGPLQKNKTAGGICSSNAFWTPLISDLYRSAGLKMYHESSGFAPSLPEQFFFNMLHAGSVVSEIGGIIHFPNPPQTKKLRVSFDNLCSTISPYVHNDQFKSELGVYFSFDSLLNSTKSFDQTAWHWRSLKPIVYGLFYTGIPCNFISDYSMDDLSKYKTVIDLSSNILREEQIKKLRNYVLQGGTLVMFHDSGMYQARAENKRNVLLKSLGANDIKIEPLSQKPVSAHWNKTKITLENPKSLQFLSPTWKALLTHKNKILIAQKNIGKGSLILIGGNLKSMNKGWHSTEEGLTNALFFNALSKQLAMQTRYVKPLHNLPIRTYCFTKNNLVYLALYNDSDDAQDGEFEIYGKYLVKKATELVFGQTLKLSNSNRIKITVPAKKLLLIECLKKNLTPRP